MSSRKVATIASYGYSRSAVEFFTVTVHEGSRVVETKMFHCKGYTSEEKLARAVMDFAESHGVAEVRQVDGVLPPEEAYCCGSVAARVS